jgi:hypothetical protein
MSAERGVFAARMMAALEAAIAGSRAELRGSLATDSADAYSDVDLRWTVPGAAFGEAVTTAPFALAGVGGELPLTRSDPDAADAHRRLLALRFPALPLFWRVDLEVVAEGAPSQAPPPDWPAPAIALEDAVAAVKAQARGADEAARDLLARGHERLGDPPTAATTPRALADRAAAEDPALAPIAARVPPPPTATPPATERRSG